MGNLGFFEFVVGAAVLFAALIGIIALVDVIRRPSWQWQQADRSRTTWVVLLLIGIFAGALGGLFVALAYYLFAQPTLKRVNPPIGAPVVAATYRSPPRPTYSSRR